MLYLAYGSNLNKKQMSRRCPKAIPLEGVVIEDWKLVFRGVADIEPSKGSMLSAGLWRITEDCEKALDSYEGYPHLYDKIYFNFDYNGKKEQVLSNRNLQTYKKPCKNMCRLIVLAFCLDC